MLLKLRALQWRQVLLKKKALSRLQAPLKRKSLRRLQALLKRKSLRRLQALLKQKSLRRLQALLKQKSLRRLHEEAAKGAGIDSFVIAEDPGIDLGKNFERTYRCMDGIAEARLEYPASALTVRKGNSTYAEEGDISGDYTEYANTWTEDVNGIEVTCFGNREGDASKSIWTVDDMYFSIVAEGLGGDEDFGLNAERLTAMVSSIQ